MRFLQSEDHILRCIDACFPRSDEHLILGRGDDCALLSATEPLCVSTDLFLEDVHFRRSYFTPYEIGHKALAVNLSDIAAMGASPCGFSMGFMIPNNLTEEYLTELMQGMADLAAHYNVPLTGGDLARSHQLGFSITVWGKKQPKGTFLQRGTCQTGDVLFTVGSLGLARVGLYFLETQGRSACSMYPQACKKHLTPEPQLTAAAILASYPVSLMDLSDGLARDIPRLLGQGVTLGQNYTGNHANQKTVPHKDMKDALHTPSVQTNETTTACVVDCALMHHTPSTQASNSTTLLPSRHCIETRAADAVTSRTMHYGAHITIDATTLHPEVLAYAQQIQSNPVHEVFQGGEDYALLGACSPSVYAKLEQSGIGELQAIGTVTESPEILLNGQRYTNKGFDHFTHIASSPKEYSR